MNVDPITKEREELGELVLHLDYIRGLPGHVQYCQLVLAIYQE